MNVCESCGKPLNWAETPDGHRIPVDPWPTLNGNLEIIDGIAHIVPVDLSATTLRYTSHLATCPNAAGHRKRDKTRP